MPNRAAIARSAPVHRFSILASADTLCRLTTHEPRKLPAATRLAMQFVLGLLPIFVWVFCLKLRKDFGLTGRGGFDEINFHKPAILQFVSEWPSFNLHDYLSATTPGYHLVQATLVHFLGQMVMPIASSAITVALFTSLLVHSLFRLAIAQHGATRTRDVAAVVGGAVLVTAPLLASPYVLASGIWLLPDNLAWLLVLETLLFSLAALSNRKFLIHAAIALFLLVCVRQIHLWAAAPMIVAAFCSSSVTAIPELIITPAHILTELKDTLTRNFAKRLSIAAIAAALTLPAILVLAYFIHLWGGLTPPTFQGQYPVDPTKPLLLRLFNAPAAPAFILALFGVFGLFYAGFWFPALLRSLKTRASFPLLLAFIAFAAILSILPATTYSMAEGRWSGLWNITTRLPVIANHTSLLILSLAVLGAITLCSFLASIRIGHALVCLTAIAGFAAAQAASFQLWQRYNEPFILIMLIIMSVLVMAHTSPSDPAPKHPLLLWLHRLRFAGPALLAILLAAISWNMFSKAKPSDFFDLKPGTDRTKAFLKGDESIKPVEFPH